MIERLREGRLMRGEKARIARQWGVAPVQVARAVAAAQAIVDEQRGIEAARLCVAELLRDAVELHRQLEAIDPLAGGNDLASDRRLVLRINCALKIATALAKIHGFYGR